MLENEHLECRMYRKIRIGLYQEEETEIEWEKSDRLDWLQVASV